MIEMVTFLSRGSPNSIMSKALRMGFFSTGSIRARMGPFPSHNIRVRMEPNPDVIRVYFGFQYRLEFDLMDIYCTNMHKGTIWIKQKESNPFPPKQQIIFPGMYSFILDYMVH